MLKDPYLLPLDFEPTEIIEAMNVIVNHSEKTGFTENTLFYLQKPIQYLCNRLKINERQAVLLSVVCELSTEGAVSINNLAEFFCCSNLTAIAYLKDLDDLVIKRLLILDKAHGNGKAYNIQWEVLTTYSHNEVYEPQRRFDTVEELLFAIESLSDEYRGCYSYENFFRQIRMMLNDNTHLAFAQSLLRHTFKRSDQAMLLNACILLCCHDQYSFDLDDIARFVDARSRTTIWREMLNGSHFLIRNGWVEASCDDGLEDVETFELTQKAKDLLLSEVTLRPASSEFKCFKDLVLPQGIIAKPLHYNSVEDAQVRRLSELLEPQRFAEVHNQLEASGMRTGFACLFYGAPGTGKTETVMQLARATSRGIFQVNMANIRSKWVGESEKNVKSLFSQYHYIVRKSEVTPILLLNEADALLGNRFTSVSHTAERMENTMQNIILQEMERLDGILIATTNLTDNLDPAFERRFLFKIRFTAPNPDTRLKIWKDMFPEIKKIKNAKTIANEYDFSGGQIENIVRKCRIESILNGNKPDFDMVKTFCDEELLAKQRTAVAGFRNKP